MVHSLIAILVGSGCAVQELCFDDGDCTDEQRCNTATGACYYECIEDSDCGTTGWECRAHRCELACEDVVLDCSSDMVQVGCFCIDVYEASRPDATATDAGTDESMATSRAGVLPWYTSDSTAMNQGVAQQACEAAGKRLCTANEWEATCTGPDQTTYAYGDDYDVEICNGIDTYCNCDPYPHCYDDCGSDNHAMPTGAFEGCTNEWGIYDINGNVWEVVASDDGADHYRGGAYNCIDSEKLHQCGYDATWDPSAKGFRCCADGEEQ